MRKTYVIAAASAAPLVLALAGASGSQAVAATQTSHDSSVFSTMLTRSPPTT